MGTIIPITLGQIVSSWAVGPSLPPPLKRTKISSDANPFVFRWMICSRRYGSQLVVSGHGVSQNDFRDQRSTIIVISELSFHVPLAVAVNVGIETEGRKGRRQANTPIQESDANEKQSLSLHKPACAVRGHAFFSDGARINIPP